MIIKRHTLAAAIAVASIAPMANAAVLEEIFVTAQKQDQRVMEIPISVSAITGDKINDAGINNLEAMSAYVPGLHIGKGPINTAINIRGIGSGIDRGFEQSVGMYIDGIYMGRSRQFRSPFLDPQRVEVLRGPQGILFGKNTIAGAVNIISADPVVDGDTEGSLAVKAEENGTYEGTGIFSTSLTSTVAARLALKFRQSDGEVENVTLGQDEPETEELSARLTVLWEPSDQLSVNTKLSYTDYTTEGSNAVATTTTAVPGNTDPLAGAAFGLLGVVAPDFLSSTDPYKAYRDDSTTWSSLNGINGWGSGVGVIPEETNTESTTLAVTAVYEFESGWGIHSITGYSEYDTDDATDADFTPLRLLLTRDKHEFEQISQEFRFTYLEGGPFEFIGGVYFEEQDLLMDSGTLVDGTFGGLIPSIFVIPEQIGRFNVFDQQSDTLAAFGEVTWYLRDDVRFTVGGRYSKEGKDVEKEVTIQDSVNGFGITSPCAAPALTAGCIATGAWANSFGTVAHDFDISGREDEFFDPSVKVQWDIDYDNMVYASFSQGHKSGGYNASADAPSTGAPSLTPEGSITYTTPGDKFSYDEETAKSIEVGYKGMVAKSSVQLGISLFATNYKDLQVAIFQGTNFTVENAAEADLFGLEVEARWAPLDNLEVGGSIAYLDFEFADYAAGCTVDGIVAVGNIDRAAGDPKGTTPCTQDFKGERNAFAPEYSGNLFADYTHDLSNGLEVKATVDVNFKSEMYLDYDLDDRVKQAGFGKVNMRVALIDENWEVAVFGRNLGDKTTHSFALDTPLLSGATTGWVDEGKLFGAEAKYSF